MRDDFEKPKVVLDCVAHFVPSGGHDIIQPVVDYLLAQFQETTGNVVPQDSPAVRRLYQEVERSASTRLGHSQIYIQIESFYRGQDFDQVITREKYAELTMVSLNDVNIFRAFFKSNLQSLKGKFHSLKINLHFMVISFVSENRLDFEVLP